MLPATVIIPDRHRLRICGAACWLALTKLRENLCLSGWWWWWKTALYDRWLGRLNRETERYKGRDGIRDEQRRWFEEKPRGRPSPVSVPRHAAVVWNPSEAVSQRESLPGPSIMKTQRRTCGKLFSCFRLGQLLLLDSNSSLSQLRKRRSFYFYC